MDRSFVQHYFDASVQRTGCENATGYDQKAALRFANAPCVPAMDYVRMSALPATQDFSLRMWIKPVGNGCHGMGSVEILPLQDFHDRAQMTDAQRTLGGVIAANIPFDTAQRPGFSVAMLQPRAYLTVNFLPEGADAPVQLTGIREACDGRWHQLVITCCRSGMLRVYIDGQVKGEANISALKDLPLPGEALMLGADSEGMCGLGDVTISDFVIEGREIPADEIEHAYYAGAVQVLAGEIAQRGLEDDNLYNNEETASVLQMAQDYAAKAQHDPQPALLLTHLREAYENLLLNTVKPDLKLLLLSDNHCEGVDGGRTQAVCRVLDWARETGVDAVLDGGDYSHFGKDYELDSYWHAMENHWAGKPLFVTVGNHETLHSTCDELVAYQCGKLHKHGMISADHNKFYYDGEVNGYHVIVLAQYSDTYTVTGYKRMWRYAAEIKQEQIDFLREKLNAYCGQGKPVFLVIHNSIEALLRKQTDGRYQDDCVLMNGGEEVYALLRNHPEVIICTGHVHHGFGSGAGFYHLDEDNYNVIDMPAPRASTWGYGCDDRTPAGTSCGAYLLSVYGKRIVLRALDFGKREFLTAYDQDVLLDI